MLEMLKARKEELQAQGKKGFTLMEMLIVIAIIAVLIAIAIPVFTAQLADANRAVDEANIRAGYAAAQAEVMMNKAGDIDKYYLQKDGTIKATNTDAYETKGDGSSVAIGGTTVTWGSGKYIVYNITTTDGTRHVNTITEEAKA